MKQHPTFDAVDMVVSGLVGIAIVVVIFLVLWGAYHWRHRQPAQAEQSSTWDLGDRELHVRLSEGLAPMPGEDHRVGDHLDADQRAIGILALGTDADDYTRVLLVDRNGYVRLSPEDEARLVTRIGKELQRVLDRNERIAQPQFSHGVSASGTQRVFLTPTDADTVVFDGAGNCLLNCEKVFLK